MKVYLITGASGGIGQAVAARLAGKETVLWLHYHKGHERAQQLMERLFSSSVEIRPASADLGKPDQVEQTFAQIKQREQQVYLPRLVQPKQVADAVAFLLSGRPSAVNGQICRWTMVII